MAGLDWILNILGGSALLIWGTRMVRTGVLRAFGGRIRRLIARATGNRFSALVTGMGVATALQSSTAAAMLTASFASKGLVTTIAGLAVALGANLGSTLVVLFLALDISWLCPMLILVGVIAFQSAGTLVYKQLGHAVLGLGLVLLALSMIVGASAALPSNDVINDLLTALSGMPLIALVIGALLTWAAHSSVAIVLMISSLVAAGALPLPLGFVLVLGANVGSGVVPFVLNWKGAPTARRILLGNLVFRILGAIAALALLDITALVSLASAMGGQTQIAGFHIVFNLALCVVFLPTLQWISPLIDKLVPQSGEGDGAVIPRYLDETVTDRPSLALGCATRELIRMADTVETMLSAVMDVFENNDEELLKKLKLMDDEADSLHESIKLYLARLSRNALENEDSRRCVELITFTTNLEHVGDIVDKNLLELANKKIKYALVFSPQGWTDLTRLHKRVLEQMQLAMSVLVQGDIETARQLIISKEKFRQSERECEKAHLDRLRNGRIETIETSSIHMDVIRDLKRINSHLASVAYPILDANGELRDSRLKKTRPSMA